jgi:enhancing lycopene biosynthesis protein 2
MRYDANDAVFVPKRFKSIKNNAERFAVQGAESLVQEEEVSTGRGMFLDAVGQ